MVGDLEQHTYRRKIFVYCYFALLPKKKEKKKGEIIKIKMAAEAGNNKTSSGQQFAMMDAAMFESVSHFCDDRGGEKPRRFVNVLPCEQRISKWDGLFWDRILIVNLVNVFFFFFFFFVGFCGGFWGARVFLLLLLLLGFSFVLVRFWCFFKT